VITFGHVNVRTNKLEESVAFYRDVLGLTPGPAATRPGSNDHVWLSDSSGKPCVHLQRATAIGMEMSGAGIHHFAFDSDDAEAWRNKLKSLGIGHEEMEFEEAGMLQFNLKDPNGLRLELTFSVA